MCVGKNIISHTKTYGPKSDDAKSMTEIFTFLRISHLVKLLQTAMRFCWYFNAGGPTKASEVLIHKHDNV